ncbi:MAG: hypothetical protein JWO38_7692 [Gemmataceae bacterium]|nr:hypothetical protein [Gemmataceae bacterium]
MASPHEHLEHAEHSAHLHDPFDKRVAVSVAIVAAVLAGISMLGHRKHNEVLELQGHSNRLQTEASIIQTKANIDHTHATDQWGFYQAKNIRKHMYTVDLGLMDVVAKDPARAKEAEDLRKKMQGQVEEYRKELPEMMDQAKALTAAGEKKQAEVIKKQEEAGEKLNESHHSHHQADRLDYAHLGAEIGIVLCSLALLTKRRVFWFTGVVAAVLAIGVTVSAFLIPHESHPTHPTLETNQAH